MAGQLQFLRDNGLSDTHSRVPRGTAEGGITFGSICRTDSMSSANRGATAAESRCTGTAPVFFRAISQLAVCRCWRPLPRCGMMRFQGISRLVPSLPPRLHRGRHPWESRACLRRPQGILARHGMGWVTTSGKVSVSKEHCVSSRTVRRGPDT